MVAEARYFQVVLISVRDQEVFEQYQSEVAPVAARYGWGERAIAPEEVYGAGIAVPDLVNVVFYDEGETGLGGLKSDPEFQAVVGLRSQSIDMVSIEGRAEYGLSTGLDQNAEGRRYLVEIARFGPGGEAAYRAYEKEAEALLSPYGYHVERVIRPTTVSPGLPFEPDLVKIAYFDDADGLRRAHEDPGHSRVEDQLYPAAAADSIWLLGTATRMPDRPDAAHR